MAKVRPLPDDDAADAVYRSALRRQVRFWLITAVIFGMFLYLFSEILLPFVAGMALAYFLDPVADWLERTGLTRTMATFLILVVFIVILSLGLIILVPVLSSQMADFIEGLPGYLNKLQDLITSLDPQWLEDRFGVNAADLREGLNSLLTSGAGLISTVFTSIWESGVALVGLASLFVVTPVVAFYMLLDWDRMVATVDSLSLIHI